ncbi:MAG: 16S rRNA (cytosine(967)-C(5))-methyltransferase RsmB [Bacteroidetes bacterium]|nr:16S rRNA (cytosine(967)-C(5))-methyltransferase RsmB [Bacteroidota bacterium]
MNNDTHSLPPLYIGVRGIAVKILTRVDRTDAYLDKLLDIELETGDLNPPDKRLLSELVHGVLRNQSKLDWVLTGFYHGQYTKVAPNIRNALRVALYQILFLSRIPHHAAVNEAVEFVKKYRGQRLADTMNGLLRNIARNVENIRYPLATNDEIQYLSVVHSHPTWIVKRWHARYGFEETESLCKANNMRPFLTLRPNPLRIDYKSFVNELVEVGIDYRRCFYMRDYVTVRNLPNIRHSRLFTEGLFTIQDESAGLVGDLLAPKPGETVIDLCSAPGGKALHAAEHMNNEGRVIAVDKYDVRLNLIHQAAERNGVMIFEIKEGDASEVELEPADKVLVDAPCSGLGTMSKKPDIKWKREMDDIHKLVKTQRAIMGNAARLVRPGGVLVYSTCTIEPEENQMIVKDFLEQHPEFEIQHAAHLLPQRVVDQEGFLATFPHKHRMDGAFGARLKRKEE